MAVFRLVFGILALSTCHALQLGRASPPALRSSSARRRSVCTLVEADEPPEQASSDAALMDSFRARLDQEGGATNLRLKTDAGRLQRAGSANVGRFKSALDLDQSKSAPSVSGRLLDKENWTATVAFLGLVIGLACFTAFTTAQPGDQVTPQQQAGRQASGTVDTFTSDGGDLMFGRR